MEPTTAELREDFKNQLRNVNERIGILTQELESFKEIRIKIIGGLETLQIIDPVQEEASTETSEENNIQFSSET
jgi:hypothetical protein